MFGYETCSELFFCLDRATSGAVHFRRLPGHEKIEEALLSAGFPSAGIETTVVEIPFKDMYELVLWLKSIGANNLPREGYIGRRAMARAADIYKNLFPSGNGIKATFEVIWVHAKK